MRTSVRRTGSNHVPADADETGGLVRRQDHGEAPLVGEQTHDGVAQIAEGRRTAWRAVVRPASGQVSESTKNGGLETTRSNFPCGANSCTGHCTNATLPPHGEASAFSRALRNVFHVDTRDPGPGDTLCHHQCNKPCTATYIEDAPVRRTHRDPGTQQHAVRPDLHRAAILAYGELFEAEHRLYALR